MGDAAGERGDRQLQQALRKLGRSPYVVAGFLTRPDEAISKLGPIDDPLIGVFVHWAYAPHTCDGVVGKDNPLLLASNFSGTWPGLVALLNTGACLESINRRHSRIWTDAADWTKDAAFMERLDEWCSTGQIRYSEKELHRSASVAPEAQALGERIAAEIRNRRVLALMLGDTSMGMINGYFGPRFLSKHGFAEHKVDQAWLIDRVKKIDARRRRRRFPLRARQGRDVPLAREGRRGFHRRSDENAAGDVPGGARSAGRVQGRLPRLAISARPVAAAAAKRLLRGLIELDVPAGDRTAISSSPRPRPTRATSCRWS